MGGQALAVRAAAPPLDLLRAACVAPVGQVVGAGPQPGAALLPFLLAAELMAQAGQALSARASCKMVVWTRPKPIVSVLPFDEADTNSCADAIELMRGLPVTVQGTDFTGLLLATGDDPAGLKAF